jgi:hypothetical protein
MVNLLKKLLQQTAVIPCTLQGGGWTAAGYQVDKQTGIGGMYYTNTNGSQVLVSGGATVTIQDSTPGPTPPGPPPGPGPGPNPTTSFQIGNITYYLGDTMICKTRNGDKAGTSGTSDFYTGGAGAKNSIWADSDNKSFENADGTDLSKKTYQDLIDNYDSLNQASGGKGVTSEGLFSFAAATPSTDMKREMILLMTNPQLMNKLDGMDHNGEFNKGDLQRSIPDSDDHVSDYGSLSQGDARKKAMDVLAANQDLIDKASSHEAVTDGNFNIRDIYNLAASRDSTIPQELKDAASYVITDDGLLRDIDGGLNNDSTGHSDGIFTWDELLGAQKHTKDPNYVFVGYDNNFKRPVDPNQITGDSQQKTLGNCSFLSAARAFEKTTQGKKILSQTVHANDDGSYDVNFKGDQYTVYHISKSDWSSFNAGDPVMQALCVAADMYYKANGHSDGVAGHFPQEVYQLLDNGQGTESDIQCSEGKDAIKAKLLQAAPLLGKSEALTLIGDPDDNANWKAGSGHAFQVESIDVATGTITYTNPWDTSVKRTITIDDLTTQMETSKAGYFQGRTYK